MKFLPPEILQLICHALRPDTTDKWLSDNRARRQTLRNLCLTNKLCRRLATAELYHTIELGDFDRARPRLLLRSLLEDRGLGRAVRNMSVDPWQGSHDDELDRAELVPGPDEVVARYPGVLEELELGTDLRGRMEEWLAKGLEDAEIAMVLSLCPGLKVLEMGLPYGVENTLVMAVFARAVGRDAEDALSIQRFDTIKEIKVRHWDTEYSTNLSEITPLLRFRGLERLDGFMISCEQGSLIISPGASSPVRHFSLQYSLVDSQGLESILTTCPEIRTLSLHWGSATVGDCEIHWEQFGEVLRRHGSRITQLTLNSEEAFEWETDAPGAFETPLGRLREMKSLQRLNLPFHALFKRDEDDSDDDDGRTQPASSQYTRIGYLAETLPTALRTLRIDADGDDDPTTRDAQLKHLMQATEFGELRSIRVKRSEPFSLDLIDVPEWSDGKSNQYWLMLDRNG